MSLDVLVPALAGYLFLRYSNLTWFGLARESGYHLAFRSALVGLGFYAAGWVVAGVVSMPGFLEASSEDARGTFEIGAAALWTLVLTGALVPVSNVVYPRKKPRGTRRVGVETFSRASWTGPASKPKRSSSPCGTARPTLAMSSRSASVDPVQRVPSLWYRC